MGQSIATRINKGREGGGGSVESRVKGKRNSVGGPQRRRLFHVFLKQAHASAVMGMGWGMGQADGQNGRSLGDEGERCQMRPFGGRVAHG